MISGLLPAGFGIPSLSGLLISPAIRAGGLVLLALALVGYIYAQGHGAATRGCEAAALRARIATLEADQTAARDAQRRAEGIAANLRARTEADQKRIADYETELAKQPARSCGLSDADVKRLRSIKR